MKYTIDNYNIILNKELNNLKDYNYIVKYRPYQISDNKYKLPLTKKSLLDFLNFYNINYKENENLSKIIFNLEIANSFNLFLNNEFHTYLRPYQIQGIKWIKYRLQTSSGLLLFWAMRTGKTITSCEATKNYKKIVVMSLAGQEQNWVDTYSQVSNYTILNLHKKNKKKRKETYKEFIKTPQNIILIGSVNTLSNDMLNEDNNNMLNLFNIDCLIIDEIHKIKNNKTKLYKGTKKIRDKSKYCLGLTGTPVSKHINEILPIFGLLLPYNFSKTYLSQYFFEQEYNVFSEYGTAGDLRKEKEQEWLEFFNLYVSQIKKEQALIWAKEPIKKVVKLYMSDKQKKVYENCLYNFEIEQTTEVQQIQEVIAQFTRLRQISINPSLVNVDAPSVKEEWLLEFLEVDEPRDGIIIFSTLTSYLNNLYNILLDKKYKVCLITGETKNKTEIANDFQNGKYDIVLANIQAGSKGITLDRADTMIFLDEDWRPDENQQAIERFTPTSEDKTKFRQVIRLEINDNFKDNILSIDKYINLVVENKITKTEIVNNFKEYFKKRFTK